MSTRSTVKFFMDTDEGEKCIVSIYHHFDGYPSGVGKNLVQFLKSKKIVCGLSGKDEENVANGIDCLAAQYIAAFKDRPGNLYLQPEHWSQEYNYEVRLNSQNNYMLIIKDDDNKIIFNDNINNFDAKKLEN